MQTRSCFFLRKLKPAPGGDEIPAHESEEINAALQLNIFLSPHELFMRILLQISLPIDPAEAQQAPRD